MTKKDYQLIARAINEARALRDEARNLESQTYAIELVIDRLAKYFAEENPRFDRVKFFEATQVSRAV